MNYEVTDTVLNTVSVTGGDGNVSGELIIPETVNHDSVDYKVTHIVEEAFRGNSKISSAVIGDNVTNIGSGAFRRLTNMTKVTIGSSVSSIGELVFAEASKLTEMVVKSNTPPLLLGGDIISTNVNLTVPEGLEKAYADAGWTGFNSINGIFKPEVGFKFIEGGLEYEVNNDYEVELLGVEDPLKLSKDLVLPSVAHYAIWGFNVSIIASNAFKGEILLNSVIIPYTVKTIRDGAFESTGITRVSFSEGLKNIYGSAFRYNKLTSVTFPSSLRWIDGNAFYDNPLETITAKGIEPASISGSSFMLRAQIDLYVSEGVKEAYINAGWTNFKSINSGVIGLAIKVYLEGAFLNPYEGEETYMRDDLRKMGLLPTKDYYLDKYEVKDPRVLSTSGANAIVDWVWVNLFDGSDGSFINGSGQAGLLQRDGDIVATDGVSNLEIGGYKIEGFKNVEPGNYYITVWSKNHLGIKSAYPITLPNSRIDFTVDPTNAVGGENSFIKVRDGVYALIGGDYDVNGQIQNSDKNHVVPIIGVSGYYREDMDMNGQVQNTDIKLLNKNLGRGIQFN
jgi:hypothetical protein